MKYYVLQFKFLTPVHFGTAQNKKSGNLQSFNCCADTFFSALATEAAALDTALCGKFIAAVREGSLLFSDLLPYYSGSEEEFYVPVPYCRSEKINTLDYGLSFTDLCLQYEARRDHENLAYIRAGGVKAYLQPFGEDEAPEQEKHSFGWSGVQRRMDFRNGGTAYYVSNYSFAEGAGLYCIVGLNDESLLDELVKTVELLGFGGIGGRRSSGFGKFVLRKAPFALNDGCSGDAGVLYELLNNNGSSLQMTLSILCPVAQQLDAVKQGSFSLMRRSGFVYNSETGGYEKRSSVYMIKAGACFGQRIDGQVLEFAAGAGHPVYRYGKALYMGLPV